MSPVAKLLQELIAIPSVNPAFVDLPDESAGEKNMADYLVAVAGSRRLDVDLQEVLPGRSNLLIRLLPKGRVRRRVLLAPHLDTVGVVDPAQWKPHLRDGRLHGRGACDTKGCVASMLTALFQVAEMPDRPEETEIVFAGLVDEENAQSGSRALVRRGFKAELAIVGEPTRLKLITAHKGDLWLEIKTRGKPAHGAMPHLGENAIHSMARVVELLETVYRDRLKRRCHPLLGHATSNVGLIEGGRQPNIVPGECAIVIDRRTLPGEKPRDIVQEIQSLVRRQKIQVEISSTKSNPCPALETSPRHPLVRQFLSQLRQPRPLGVDFFCDAAVLASGNIPSVVFGPGDIAQAHTADEWISIAELEKATAILTRFLGSLP